MAGVRKYRTFADGLAKGPDLTLSGRCRWCKTQADRAKTQCDALYGRPESEFSRFFPLRTPTGPEIGAALDAPRSFRTVCETCARTDSPRRSRTFEFNT